MGWKVITWLNTSFDAPSDQNSTDRLLYPFVLYSWANRYSQWIIWPGREKLTQRLAIKVVNRVAAKKLWWAQTKLKEDVTKHKTFSGHKVFIINCEPRKAWSSVPSWKKSPWIWRKLSKRWKRTLGKERICYQKKRWIIVGLLYNWVEIQWDSQKVWASKFNCNWTTSVHFASTCKTSQWTIDIH